ncbi:uroporphyrinogen-III synthase [Salinimicrobium soli]|uniref:uroporphyrinogen-III synthase n=1 Tax=Salinimicrobium soli TaxID=1254399 RepID=UPI003AAD0D37
MSATVLSTKKLTAAQKELLINAGIGLVEKDFISIAPLEFEVHKLPKNVIFTSKNAVKAVLKKPFLKELQQKNVFCVGDKTADYLRGKNFKVIESANYGSELGALISENYEDEDFLFFCGKKRNPELEEILKANSVDLEVIEVYDTLPAPKKYDRIFDGVLFFSPSAVEYFTAENELSESIAFCIGKTTASEASKYTSHVVMANRPSIENVIVQAVKKLKNEK